MFDETSQTNYLFNSFVILGPLKDPLRKIILEIFCAPSAIKNEVWVPCTLTFYFRGSQPWGRDLNCAHVVTV